MKKKIVCIHLLNDYSGSPLVLSQVIKGFKKNGYQIDLYTSNNGSQGFLLNLGGINYNTFFYKWNKSKILTLIFFLFSQSLLFFKLLKYRKQDVTFYINTVLPFGAALAGKLMGKRILYHIHETSIKPKILKQLYFRIIRYTASDVIYVSEYLKEKERVDNVNCHTVHNAIPEEFIEVAQ